LVILVYALIVAWGIWSVAGTPLDALPDLSENQVIIYTDYPGQSPYTVEDQVTYPLETAMMGLPHVKDVRGQSNFGFSFVYVIFDDAVDYYWARTRVLERLNAVQNQLPPKVSPRLGPEGTGVGHVLWYLLRGDGYDLAELRSIQDWFVRYQLASVDGVAEVASIGGFVREYQVDLDPIKLRSYKISPTMVAMAIEKANQEAGGRILEQSNVEYFIRGKGYIRGINDIENIVVMTSETGVPVTIKDLGVVQLGTGMRDGMLDLNGEGEVVGGIVVMRYGENAKRVIDRVKKKIQEVERGLPQGVRLEIFYDRSGLIERSVHTLTRTLIEESIIVAFIILIFLMHLPSAFVVILTLPIAVLIAFIFMRYLNITSNIMSLGGVAISIGVLVDASIVLVENAYRQLAEAQEKGPVDAKSRVEIVINAGKQVGKAIFFSLIIIVLSFAPLFFLTAQEGKLFKPLAFTKTFTMLGASIIAITLTPALMILFVRGKLVPQWKNPVAAFFDWLYEPFVKWALRLGWLVLLVVVGILLWTWPIYKKLGHEFMPNLNEGELLFMPTLFPNASISEVKRVTQIQDKIMTTHPQVKRVLGKVGRADTATDPAPVEMVETIVQLTDPKTWPRGKTINDIRSELDKKLKIPGVTNAWTMPIINRIQMLSTGVRTDVGIKIYGTDLGTLAELALEAERIAKTVPGAVDVFAERTVGGRYISIEVDRQALAKYGVSIEQVQMVINTAIGGMEQTVTIEGRERYPVRIRYYRDLRDDIDELMEVLVETPMHGLIPLRSVAKVYYEDGPPMISSENGLLRSVVFLNIRGRDMGSTVTELEQRLKEQLKLPQGYYFRISGQWESQVRARKTLSFIVPVAILLIFILLYLTFNSVVDTLIVMLSVPFALVGGVIMLAHFNYNISVAVMVGFIALFGVAVETGVVMLVYLNEALDKRIINRVKLTPAVIREAAYEGAALRLRPKLMTVGTSLIGLLPILWATGTGSDVMKPIAVPLIGGMISSTILVLIVIPVVFVIVRVAQLRILGEIKPSAGRH